MSTENRIVIVIDANGQAAIGEVDATTGAFKRLGGSLDEIAPKLKKVGDSTDDATKKAEAAAKKAEANGKVIGEGIGLLVAGLVAMELHSINAIDTVGKMAERLGVSSTFMSEMGFAAKTTGANVQTLEQGLLHLGEQATKAEAGSKREKALFEAIGVSATDAHGKLQSLEQLLPQIADKFAGMADGPQKAALAGKLFGEQFGPKLVPLLNQGAAGIEQLRKKAKELGLSLGDEDTKAAAAFTGQLGELNSIAQGFFVSLAKDLLPVLKVLGGLLIEQGESSAHAAEGTSVLTKVVQVLATAAIFAKSVWESLINLVFASVSTVASVVSGVLGTISDVITTTKSNLSKIAHGDFQGAVAASLALDNRVRERMVQTGNKVGAAWDAAGIGVEQAVKGGASAISNIWNPAVDASTGSAKKATQGEIDLGKVFGATGESAEAAERKLRRLLAAREEWTAKVIKMRSELIGSGTNAEFENAHAVAEAEFEHARALIEANKALKAREILQTDYNELTKKGGLIDQQRAHTLKQIADEQARTDGNAVRATEESLKNARDEIRLMSLSDGPRDREIEKLRDEETLRRMLLQLEEDRVRITADAYNQAKKNIELLDVELKKRRELQDIQSLRQGGLFELFNQSLEESFRDGAEVFSEILKDNWKKIFAPTGTDQNGNLTGKFTGKDVEGIANFIGDSASSLQFIADQFRENKDAPLNALVNIATKIPGPIGAVAQAVQSINSLFGGGLLGTNFKLESSSRNIRMDGEGLSGSTAIVESKKKAFFGGTKRRTTTTNLDFQAQDQLDTIFEQMALSIQSAARELGVNVPEIVTGAFKETFDKNGKMTSSIATVLGRSYTESLESFTKRVQAENLIAVLDAVMPQAELQRIAEGWRDDADALLNGATFLLAVQSDIQRGQALFNAAGDGVMTALVKAVEDLQQPGEALIQTYQRLTQTARAYGQVAASAEGELLLANVSDFAKSIIQIRQEELSRTKALKDQARALGGIAAREEDLVRVRLAAQAKLDAAAKAREFELQDVVAELYGTPLQQIEDQIAALGGAAADGKNSLKNFLESLRMGDLSPLTDAQKHQLALQDMQGAAGRGDVSGFTAAAQQFLEISRRLNASGQDFRNDFDLVNQLGGSGFGGAGNLQDLMAQRDAALARQQQAERLGQARELAQGIADLSDVRGQNFNDVAQGLGVDLGALAKDLGLGSDAINDYLTSLQVDTADLAQILFDLPDRFAHAMFDVLMAANATEQDPSTLPIPGPIPPPGGGGGGGDRGGGDRGGPFQPVGENNEAIVAALRALDTRLAAIETHTAVTASSNTQMATQSSLDALRAELHTT